MNLGNREHDIEEMNEYFNFFFLQILMDRCKNAGWTRNKEDKNVIKDEKTKW